MSNGKGSELARYVAHLFHVAVQSYLGLFLLLLMAPLLSFFAKSQRWTDSGVYDQLIGAFGEVWIGNLSTVTGAKVMLLALLSYPVGFIFSECGYRFGVRVGYHDGLDVEEGGFSVEHFKFRCWILKNPVEHRLWDWQLFQFEFCYYTELLFSVFSLALAVAMVIPLVYYHSLTVIGAAFFGTVIMLALSVAVWQLMRIAREIKLNDYRNVNKAIRAIYELDCNEDLRGAPETSAVDKDRPA